MNAWILIHPIADLISNTRIKAEKPTSISIVFRLYCWSPLGLQQQKWFCPLTPFHLCRDEDGFVSRLTCDIYHAGLATSCDIYQ